jgi:hypothetical protein
MKKSIICVVIIAMLLCIASCTPQPTKVYVHDTTGWNDEWVLVDIAEAKGKEYIPLSDSSITEIIKREFKREMGYEAVRATLVWDEIDNDETYQVWIVISVKEEKVRGWYMWATMLSNGTIKNLDVGGEI